MSKQEFLKGQTHFIKVDIHCEGCKEKVRKQLQKIDGVYAVKIDAEQGKVAVTGNVDPATLLKKLAKSGKHAELWGPQKGSFNLNNQFKNLQIDNSKGNKSLKGGKQQKSGDAQEFFQQMQNSKGSKGQKNGAQEVLQEMHNFKGSNDLKLPKDQKTVKFKMPQDEDDEFDDDFDEFDDEYDDESDEDLDDGFGGSPEKPAKKNKPAKAGGSGGGGSQNHGKGHNGSSGGIKGLLMGVFGGAKKGSGADKKVKGKGEKHDGKKGNSKNGKGGNQNHGGQAGGKNGGGGKNGKGSGKGGGKNNDNWGNNGGGKMNGGTMINNVPKGGGMMNQMPLQMGNLPGIQMPRMGNFPTGQMGMPLGAAPPMMNPGFQQGMGQGNPYMNQQYMAQMMMMNQQHANGGGGMYQQHPMMYARPAMPGAIPQPANDDYTFMFNDENANSCSIM